MRSESTSALGHPSETKLTLGAAACCMFNICLIDGQELVPIAHNYKALSRHAACYGCFAGIRVIDGRRVLTQNRHRRRKPDPCRDPRGGMAESRFYRCGAYQPNAEFAGADLRA